MFTTFGWKKKIVITEGVSMRKKSLPMEAKASLFRVSIFKGLFLDRILPYG